MSIPCDISPSVILGAIRLGLVAEATKVPVDRDITMPRHIVWMLAASLGEVIDQIDALMESQAVADRLTRELGRARAEIDRLERRLGGDHGRSLYAPWPKGPEERRRVGPGEVIDLSEIMRREQTVTRLRPADGPEGGAA